MSEPAMEVVEHTAFAHKEYFMVTVSINHYACKAKTISFGSIIKSNFVFYYKLPSTQLMIGFTDS